MHRVASIFCLAGLLLAGTPLVAQDRTLTGEIAETDATTSDGKRYDEYRIQLEADRPYRFTATSESFSPIIRLFTADRATMLFEMDDFDQDGVAIFVLPAAGEYLLLVLTDEEDRGDYRVTVEPRTPLGTPVASSPDSRATTRWQIWNGALAAADPEWEGQYFDDYAVTMRAGETRLISVESDNFDPLVWVLRGTDRGGTPLDEDDDAGPGLSALLGFRADEAGEYIVRVTAYRPGVTGRYRVRISDPLSPAVLLPPATSAQQE